MEEIFTKVKIKIHLTLIHNQMRIVNHTDKIIIQIMIDINKIKERMIKITKIKLNRFINRMTI